MHEQRTMLLVATGLASETGRRKANEDFAAVCLEEAGRLTGVVAALADGVGGSKGGRVAAELAVRGFLEGYLGQSETLSPRRTAARALESVNRWIHDQGRTDAALENMACTLTGVVLRGRQLHMFHVGDTRLYRLREGQMTLLTRDHRPDSGAMSNLLTRAVGAEHTVRIDYGCEDLQQHDRLMLCSDGVHGPLNERRIEELLGLRDAPEETARRLVRAALDAGGEDNASALVIDVLDLPAADLAHLGEAAANLPVRSPPVAGETVDGFTLLTVLADGRYSRVFKAHDRTTGESLLLKFPKTSPGAEAGARSAFVREAWVAGRVSNPWVGAVVQLPPGRQTALYLVQPFYEGETLEQRLSRSPAVSLKQGLEIAISLAKAVASLHRAGIIHRDIKPDNIILEAGGGVKLIDLGVARLPHLDALPGVDAPGTPSYVAPEIFAGEPAAEPSDIFALGVTIYRMFSGGAYPYGEVEPFQTPRFRKPSPLSQHRPDLPIWLEAAVGQAIAVSPGDRFQDGFELAYELEKGAIGGASIKRRPQSLYERDPLRFWQGIALVLFVLLIVSLASR